MRIVWMMIVGCLLLGASPASAQNPADLTLDYRIFPVRFFTSSWDTDGRFLWYNQPVGRNTSFGLTNWRSYAAGLELSEVSVTQRVARGLDASYRFGRFEGLTDATLSEVLLDYTTGGFGLGAAIPLNSATEPKLAFRYATGRWRLLGTFGENARPIWGATYTGKRWMVELAGNEDVQFLRVINRGKRLIPSFRLKREGGELVPGFGLGIVLD